MNPSLPSQDQIHIAVIGLGYVGLPLAAAFGRQFPTLGFDINNKRVAELQRLKDEAESANRTKSDFLSKMSHELRTPLNAILGFSQLMHYDQSHPLCDEQRESVDEILAAGRHLLDIVDEMLDLTRIEIGKLRVSLERIDLRDTCGECLAMVQSEASHRQIDVHFSIPASTATWALADRTRARQILLNLLSNAVKYNHPFGHVELSIDTSVAPGYVRVVVTDDGPGLSPTRLQALQQDQGELLDSSGYAGDGLGLLIVRDLVRSSHGRLQFGTSTLGGLQVVIHWPSVGSRGSPA